MHMTKAECQQAIEHAESVMLLLLSQDEEKYGETVRAWLDKYGGNIGNKELGYPKK